MGKKKRDLLPSELRVEYVESLRLSRISLGIKNRYIDDFLRFCLAKYGHSDAEKVTRSQFVAWAKSLTKSTVKVQTARLKVNVVLQWFAWMGEHGKIGSNPLEKQLSRKLVERTKIGPN